MLLTGTINSQKAETIISYKKGACMGKCPVYSITVDAEGRLVYHGLVNVEKAGLYSRQLTKKEFKKVKCKFKKARFHKLDEKYGMDIMDAPMTTYKYKSPKIEKTIKVKTDTPKKLLKAEQYLQSLITDTDEITYTWEKEEGPSDSFGRKEMAERMIIVQLKPDVNVDAWLKKYQKYNVRNLKKIVPNRPLYLLAFNHATIQLPQLLSRMNKDEDVDSAEENKKIKMR